jgi:hypothetical protein
MSFQGVYFFASKINVCMILWNYGYKLGTSVHTCFGADRVYAMYAMGFFLAVNVMGHGTNDSPPSTAEGSEKLELYLHKNNAHIGLSNV